jgi:NAD(P)-dependent dehydrogenase (short-subunit alcohol dehydrogenase family)
MRVNARRGNAPSRNGGVREGPAIYFVEQGEARMRFKGKSVLVTGAAGGIGRASAVAFAAEGASLVIADLKLEALEQTAQLCRARGAMVQALGCDVADDAAPQLLVRTALEHHGRLDVAFNNAGIVGDNVDVADYPDATWDRVMDVNVRAVFRAMKAQVHAMRQQGGGAIVNTASVASTHAMRLGSGYVAAKHALLGLTRAAALDVIADGIRVNAVCPGIIDTPLMEHGRKVPGLIDALQAAVPMGRMGRAEEVARLVLFLASEEASYMVGQGVLVDGGVTVM